MSGGVDSHAASPRECVPIVGRRHADLFLEQFRELRRVVVSQRTRDGFHLGVRLLQRAGGFPHAARKQELCRRLPDLPAEETTEVAARQV